MASKFTKKTFPKSGKSYVFRNGSPEALFAGMYGEGLRTNRSCQECKKGTLYAFEDKYVCRRCGAEVGC